MNLYYFLIAVLFSCNSVGKHKSKCFVDMGIRSAEIEAVLLSDTSQVVLGEMQFNTLGKPLMRQERDRKIEYKYQNNNLTRTIVHEKAEMLNYMRIDTNVVVNNDEFGRALTIIGRDGRSSEYIYINCDVEIMLYKESDGKLIHEFKSVSKDGLLRETIWDEGNDSKKNQAKLF